MSREICEGCGRTISLCTCIPQGSRQETPCIEQTSEEIASEIVKRETSDSLDEEILFQKVGDLTEQLEQITNERNEARRVINKLVEEQDDLISFCEVIHTALKIHKKMGFRCIDWNSLQVTVKEKILKYKPE